jgi:hemoglobin
MAATMFERYGGFAQVRRIVSSFYDKVLASPSLERYFADTDMRSLIDHQSQFIAQLMGGPVHYTSEALERAHAKLGIDKQAYDEVTSLLLETLEDFGIETDDLGDIGAQIQRLERFIVSRR